MRKKLTFLLIAILASLGAMASPPHQDEGNVAKVGSTEYATIEEAVAAWGPGKTLTLLSDVTTTSTVTVEVNATKSTQNWILELGDYTWTANGCNAFEVYAAGGTPIHGNYGLKVYANQHGGVTASGKYAFRYYDDKQKVDKGYRARVEINGGTYNAAYVFNYDHGALFGYVSSSTLNGASVFLDKSKDGSEPVFNGNFELSKCRVEIKAGYFNGTTFKVYRVTSTVDPCIYGGHFKEYKAFPVPGNDKGLKFDNYRVFVKSDASIDVVNGAPAEYEAKATKTLLLSANQSKDYPDYVYYEKADDAIKKYASGNIDVILSKNVTASENKSYTRGTLTIDASAEGSAYTGNITLNGANAKFIVKFPEGGGHYGVSAKSPGRIHVEETVADGIVTRTYSYLGTVDDPEAKIGDTGYSTVYDAFYAVDGTTDNKVIVLQKDVTNAGIVTNGTATGGDGKTVATFDLNGKSIGIGSVAAGNNADYTLTIIDSSEEKTGTVTNSDASLFILALTGINDYSGSYKLKIQAGTWQFNPSAVVIKGETHDLVDEGYVARDNGDGTWTVGELPYVAQYKENKYRTLQAALDAAKDVDDLNIVIDLLDDVTLYIDAWDGTKNKSSIGTVNTQSITINGNNHKLDFVNKNSDWNNVATMNDAQTKLILNDMTITNSGHNDGPWNRHDINFNCAVKLNNVTSDKALAFKNSATLKNVTITETRAEGSGDYCIWISPRVENQTITIDGLTATATNTNKNGRGIKVDDQYVDNPPKVTLNIANSKFTTDKKAAILLKSAGGVDVIDGGNNNIENVAADKVNLVWVDEDKAEEFYMYSLTSSTGATMVPESKESDYVARLSDAEGKILGYYKGTNAIANAVGKADTGYTVTIFKAGNYTMPGLPKNITVEAAENVGGVVFDHTGSGNIASVPNGATFKKLTFNFGSVNYHGFQQAGTINMEGCTLNGKLFSYGDMNFTNCAFNHSGDYNMWCYGPSVVKYTGCTFTNDGKFLHVYREGAEPNEVHVENCQFINTGSKANKAAVNVKETCTKDGTIINLTADVYIKNCTTEGHFPAASISSDLVVLNELVQVDDRNGDAVDKIRVWKDDVQIYPLKPVAKIGEIGYPTLQSAVDAAYKMTGDVTIQLVDNITEYAIVLQKAGLNLTIDGKDGDTNHTIKGQIVIDGMGLDGAETLTITNIEFEAGNILTGTDAFILVPNPKDANKPWTNTTPSHNNHAHNITISNCSFTGEEGTNALVAVKTNSGTDGSKNLSFNNNTAANLHSFAQLTAVTGMTFNGNEVTAAGSFVNISGGNAADAVFSDNKFTSAKLKNDNYAVRVKGGSGAKVTLTGNEFEAPYIVEYGDGSVLTQDLSIESGIYVGDVIFDAKEGTTGKIVISGGHFSAPLGNSEYSAFIAEGFSGVNGIYLSETPKAPNGLGDAVATLTSEGKTSNYASLETAFADAADGATITLLKNCAGNGIKAPQGKFTNGLTVDFGGFTYTMDGSMVGSTGTETQAFQLLKDNNITFKNGTITSDKAYMLIQNYSNLTLQGMTLTLNNKNYSNGYTLSNNNGNVTIDNSTINANTGGGFAFDVCRYATYPSVSVTVKGGSTINGDVEVSASNNDAKEGFLLMLEEGSISGNIVLDESAKTAMAATPEKALVREFDSFGQAEPDGYKWEAYEVGKSQLVPANYIAQVENKKYETFAEAVAAAAGTKVIVLLKDIADTYAMSQGETLKVQKDGKAFNDPTAPADFTLKTLIDGAVTIYSVKANENLATISEGYYHIKNLGNEKYVNVKGRRTATVDASDVDTQTAAGTIIKVKATNGQVEVLRSQAIDIPHYADRAMSYVHDFAKILVEKLNASGSGEILGTTGYEAIMKKFDDNFDHHLYVEQAQGGYRIFGRTPSMKPVVEFYQENKDKVDAKLPMLEQKINDAIAKVVDKVGKGYSFKDSFKLHTIWQRMNNSALTEPNDDATKLAFLQEVLSSEINVWNFAYESATFYMEKVEGSQYFEQIPAEIRNYWNLAKQVHPDFKYYIVQKDGKMDFISEGNTDIINNNPRTVWALEKVDKMTVSVPEENSRVVGATFDEAGKRTGFETAYYTTLYTDFGYQLPEGVTALKVTKIKDTYLVKQTPENKLTYESDGVTLGLGLLETEEIGQEVPAQTPVLIMSKSAEPFQITIGDSYGASADVTDNLLHGADWLINEYKINTPALESLFALVEGKVSESITDKYEHLLRRNSGTVNNKYFFPISVEEDLAPAYKNKTGYKMQISPVLVLGKKEGKKLAFNETKDVIQANSVFLFSEENKPALFTLTGDVTRDGIIDVEDVTGQVNIVQKRDKKEYNYDYDAADVVVGETYYVDVDDVTRVLNIIQKRTDHPDLP